MPVNTPAETTILSSIRVNGATAYTAYSGGTTAEKFVEYLKSTLIPTLDKNSIAVMDNILSHHAKDVKAIPEQFDIRYLYLPPYSPDLNPIEKLWSKIKAFLRKEKVRAAEELTAAIERAFSTISVFDCEEWFRASGYMH